MSYIRRRSHAGSVSERRTSTRASLKNRNGVKQKAATR